MFIAVGGLTVGGGGFCRKYLVVRKISKIFPKPLIILFHEGTIESLK